MRRSGWRGAELADGEGGEADDADAADAERLRGDPAGRVGLGDRVDDRGEAAGGEHGAAEVEATPARLLRVGGHDPAGADGERRRRRAG